jgi:hypothetical protein
VEPRAPEETAVNTGERLSRAGNSMDLGSARVSAALEGRRSRFRGLGNGSKEYREYGSSGVAVGVGNDQGECG